jgi:ABC-type amino acid transport system permease subunit
MPANGIFSSNKQSMMPLISSEMARDAGASTNWRPQALQAYFGCPYDHAIGAGLAAYMAEIYRAGIE